mmetsp:Transcript_47689/g.103725  ORF Transcript_47689/g.103725 Transcript_47689/m.103725 type:complete len:315 (+) Transcript_47689:813-1757(+)
MMTMEHWREIGSSISSDVRSSFVEQNTVTRLKDKQERRSMEVFTKAVIAEKDWTFSPTISMVLSGGIGNDGSISVPAVKEVRAPICASTRMLLRILGCFLLLTMPPMKKDMPSTKSRFESTDPSKVALTTPMRPARMVCKVITISTALPKVALRRPASMSFLSPAASSSVASPRIFARGTSAKKLNQNVLEMPQPILSERTPSGKHTSKMFNGCIRIPCSPSPSLFGGFKILVPFTNREESLLFTGLLSEALLLASFGCTRASRGEPWTAGMPVIVVPFVRGLISRMRGYVTRHRAGTCREVAGALNALPGAAL